MDTSYNKNLKIAQDDIISKLNSSSTNNPTLLKNFFGIAPFDYEGLYLASEGQMSITKPKYGYFTYDTSNVTQSFSRSDYYIAMHNTNLLSPAVPVNKMNTTIDSICLLYTSDAADE